MKAEHVRVLVAYSNHGTAAIEGDNLASFVFTRGLDRPLPGDWVDISSTGKLSKIYQRISLFGRGDNQGLFKPTAANVDQLVIVIAPKPAPSLDLITRYLVMAELQRIQAMIVVNKSDLGIPENAPFSDLPYLRSIGYSVHPASIHDPASIEQFMQQLTGHTSILAGQSGVGKSSLLNRLIPSLEAITGQLSQATGKGKHTTTTTRLYPLPEGGFVVDSPGVWEYGLWQIPYDMLAQTFRDFRPFLGHCRFRDCRHEHEPGCAIIHAVAEGQLPAFRHATWCRLLAEQKRYEKHPCYQGKVSPDA